jgi:foldase protein PrsA
VKRLWAGLVAVVITGGMAGTAPAFAAPRTVKPDEVAARVNGQPITAGELQAECLARFGAETLGQMIQYRIVAAAAEKQNVQVTEKEIMDRIKALQVRLDMQRSQTGLGFREWMQSHRISLRELASQAQMELQLEKMVSHKVTISDQDVSRYYENNRERLRRPERMLISHIAVQTSEEAERVRQEILSGKITFADAAAKYSIDPYGRENGGIFGWIVRGDDPVQKAAFQLSKDGDISPPVQGKKGWEIIRRDGYQSERIPPFEEVEDTIRSLLTAEKTQRLAQQLLSELTRSANVEQLIDFKALNEDMQQLIEAAQQATAAGEGTGK